jgi:hypothetical protein
MAPSFHHPHSALKTRSPVVGPELAQPLETRRHGRELGREPVRADILLFSQEADGAEALANRVAVHPVAALCAVE